METLKPTTSLDTPTPAAETKELLDFPIVWIDTEEKTIHILHKGLEAGDAIEIYEDTELKERFVEIDTEVSKIAFPRIRKRLTRLAEEQADVNTAIDDIANIMMEAEREKDQAIDERSAQGVEEILDQEAVRRGDNELFDELERRETIDSESARFRQLLKDIGSDSEE